MKHSFDYKIGVISDTHGLVRQRVVDLFSGVDLIIHAGDIGNKGVLETLQTIARVHAVHGNVDGSELAANLPRTDVVKAGEVCFYILHDICKLDLNPAEAGFHAVISGHSHMPEIEKRDGVLFLNPGSAGPRRLDLPVT
ncbi:MAG: metallophosphoesterase family protein, partial [Planctomycetes bacterium]|nr:metallophosphoesterase family protein [Planctomycetota bacterium]